MKRIIYFLLFTLLSANWAVGQTTIYTTQTFGTGSSLPTSWTTASGSITASTINPSNGYTGASGSGNLTFDNNVNGDQSIILNTGTLSTVGFTNITISLGASSSSLPNASFPGLTIQYSINAGASWLNSGYPDINNFDDSWANVTWSLPTNAEGVSNLQFRFIFTGDSGGDIYQIDDFGITGTAGAVAIYYSKVTGFLNLESTWGTNTDGSGTSPLNFTNSAATFNIANNATPTINAAWIVAGMVAVNSGSNFTIPSSSLCTVGGGIDVNSGGTLTMNNATLPVFGTISSGSTIVYGYSGGTQSVVATTYGNLTTSGSTAALASGSTTVTGILTLNSRLNIGASNSLTLNGAVAGASTIGGTATSNLTIGGSGSLGTLTFAAGARNLSVFTIDRASSGTVTLGSALQINSQLVLTNGTLVTNAQPLTLSNASIANTNGNIRGNSSTNITFSGSGTGGTLIMDQSNVAGGTNSLNALTTNRAITLGSDLTMVGTLTLQTGSYNFTVGSNTLTLNGPAIVVTSPAVFSTTSSSNLVFGGSSGSVTIPSTVADINNLTINNTNGVTISSTTTTVAGTLTLTDGAFSIGINTLNLNGAVSATSGTLSSSSTGTVAYMQLSHGQSVVAADYGSLTFSDYQKVLPNGTVRVAGLFTTGNSPTAHTIAGSTLVYNGTGAQTISVFNYDNLIISGSTGRAITLPSGTIGIANSFTTNSQVFTVTAGNTFNYYGAGNQTIRAAVNYYNLSFATIGTKTIDNNLTVTNDLTIGTGTTLSTSGSSYNVTVGGNWINNGSFTSGISTIIFNGSGTQTISGTATSNFYNLTKSNASTLTLSHAVSLTNLLTIASGATFNSSGYLTLLSDASGTAMIGDLTGVTFNGNITAQRYIPGGIRSYRFISAPTQSFNLNQLLDDIFILGSTASGFDSSPNQNPSAHTFNTSSNSWAAITSLTTPISTGTGFRIFAMGDRTQTAARTNTYVIPNPVTLDFIGAVNKGAITLPTTDAGTNRWNLVGNPYPCTIDWDAAGWTKTNINDAVYVWKPAGNNTGSYATYINGVPVNSGSRYIAPGLGFMVRVSAAGASELSVSEAVKVTNQSPTVGFRQAVDASLLKIIMKDSKGSSDETVIRFMAGATPGFDKELDAIKLNNPGDGVDSQGLNISSKSINDYLVVNTLPELIKSDSISLKTTNNVTGTHKLEFSGMESFSSENLILLYDAFTKITTDILAEPIYSFNITTADSSSFGTDRFKLYFSAKENNTNLAAVATIYPNPSDGTFKLHIRNPKSEQVSWKAYNLTGQIIAEKKYTTPVDGLIEEVKLSANQGIYILSIKIGEQLINKKFIIQK
ncbi:MAG: T9SS type A sorting domain-containing protein [Bacteroidota bacterium]